MYTQAFLISSISLFFGRVRIEQSSWVETKKHNMTFIVLALTEELIRSVETIQHTHNTIVLVEPKQ